MTAEPVKFLLVDDSEENLIALEALLRRDGLMILKVRSGPEALELLLIHDVALALIDVQMPDMDGFELAELMRGAERTKNIPIIFVTGAAHEAQRLFKGYEKGAVDFLFKPIEPTVLRGKADVFFELYLQRRELSDALRLSEMFVGILGHDLRNPLSTLLTGVQLLEQQLPDEKTQRTLRRMISAGHRMTDMIEQMLDLTRARLAGGLDFARGRKPLDVGQLVQRAVEELRGVHPDRAVVVEVRGECTTTGDAGRLLQIFSNLVANALHHGTAGSPVSVLVEGTEREILVQVKNRGVIPADLLPRIFDPFRGRQRYSSSQSRGLGLGLFISQQIAVAHGGAVEVESNESAGTAFTVRLPRRSAGPKHAPATPRTVLIVDDDENIRRSLREAFEEEGYRAITAANGQEALDHLATGSPRPDVVLLDLVLPVPDGARVHRAMQSDPALAGIPVVVSVSNSARAPTGVVTIPKPLKLDRLLDTVADLWHEAPD